MGVGEDINIPHTINMGIAATDRKDYELGFQLLSNAYTLVKAEQYPQGMSSYGLCLAKLGKKMKQAAELCEKAISLQSYEGRHYANLVRVYITGKNRKRAVQILEKALGQLKNDPALIRVRDEIGYRQAPSLSFIPRTNPVNKAFSVVAARAQRRRKVIFIVASTIFYAAVIIGVCAMILK